MPVPRLSKLADDFRRGLVVDKMDAVAQRQFSLLKPLNLQGIRPDTVLQRLDGRIEVPMLLEQACQGRPKLAFFVFGHPPMPGAAGAPRVNAGRRLGLSC